MSFGFFIVLLLALVGVVVPTIYTLVRLCRLGRVARVLCGVFVLLLILLAFGSFGDETVGEREAQAVMFMGVWACVFYGFAAVTATVWGLFAWWRRRSSQGQGKFVR